MAYGGLDALGQPKNRFPGPSAYNIQDKRYYPIVSDDGVVQIYRDQSVAGVSFGNPSIGTYNTKTKQFTFTKGPDGKVSSDVSPQEQQYFSSQAGRNQLQTTASQVVSQTVVEAGGTPEQGQQAASNVTGAPDGSPGSSDQVSGGLSSFDLSAAQQSIGDGGYRKKYSGGVRGDYYIYPIDMKDTQDRIVFTMYRYQPKPISASNISASSESVFGKRELKEKLGQVILPIQPSISDSNVVQWGESPINSLEAIAAIASYGTIQKGGEGLGEAMQGVTDLLTNKGSNKDVKAALTAATAGLAAGVNKDFLTRVTGGIINPNLELLFQGPQLRSFNFTFDMSAREPKEAEEIRRIIRFFKQGMSVKKSTSFLFLKSPNIFDIQYKFGANEEHPYLNKIKTCALQNCAVNYTPGQNYATYNDGAMTQYNITLTFSELDPIYDDEYGIEDNTTNIGF